MKYTCDHCGKPTDNEKLIGTILCHTCDECLRRIHLEVAWESENEQRHENTIICPFCDHEYDAYDAYGYEEGEHEEVECEACGRKFELEVEMIARFSTKRSACEMPEGYTGEEEE